MDIGSHTEHCLPGVHRFSVKSLKFLIAVITLSQAVECVGGKKQFIPHEHVCSYGVESASSALLELPHLIRRGNHSASRPASGNLAFLLTLLPKKRASLLSRLYSGLLASPAQAKLALLKDGKDRSGAFSILEISGRQHWVEVGRHYDVYRIHQAPGRKIACHRVLIHETSDGRFFLGQPYLDNVRVTAEVVAHFRGHKVFVFKHRPKKHYRRHYGHRQEMTRLKVLKVDVLDQTSDAVGGVKNYLHGDPLYGLLKKCQLRGVSRAGSPPSFTFNNKGKCSYKKKLTQGDELRDFDPLLNKQLIREQLML